ncbi:hypothetical protein JEQ12_012783 [Ovis aries]|uniref:Uncharacterized protein n=1 Tax=Ovis aries TaxID=9940 RepID=A0A835ZN51_SHEEP|nr:hypothetical protein JEQ12_012783 [Ovis aries]
MLEEPPGLPEPHVPSSAARMPAPDRGTWSCRSLLPAGSQVSDLGQQAAFAAENKSLNRALPDSSQRQAAQSNRVVCCEYDIF